VSATPTPLHWMVPRSSCGVWPRNINRKRQKLRMGSLSISASLRHGSGNFWQNGVQLAPETPIRAAYGNAPSDLYWLPRKRLSGFLKLT
jgi:hypothetical protein